MMAKYTDSQIRNMAAALWQWSDQLREEAKRRKLAVSPVTPMAEVVSLLKASLKALLVTVLVGSCGPSRWEGIPEDRMCSYAGQGNPVTCISGGKVYACVRDGDVVHCSRDTVEVKCANIVNVETVCPGKETK